MPQLHHNHWIKLMLLALIYLGQTSCDHQHHHHHQANIIINNNNNIDDIQSQNIMNNNQINNLVIIRLYHAFNSEQNYQYRGLLTIQNNVPIIKQDLINDEQLQLLRESAKNGDNYYLKAEAHQTLVFEHEKPYQITKTFIPACALLESSLNDQLWISLDVNSRFVYLMANVPNVYCSSSSTLSTSSIDNSWTLKSFNTTVLYSKTVISSGPETKTYLLRVEQQRQEKLRGNKQDNRSFLAKYWIYIVPVMFFMILSSSMNPEAGGQR
ncbi:ER membrane protein complex subunit 10 [Dermatophagoides farinae]|uniref:ER membrane protein complex subunit 10 n=1 Tax=Dermatophagoides farinae TaxID=6954 RepID=UPI003F5F1205